MKGRLGPLLLCIIGIYLVIFVFAVVKTFS